MSLKPDSAIEGSASGSASGSAATSWTGFALESGLLQAGRTALIPWDRLDAWGLIIS